MKITRRKVLKLGLAGSGVILSPIGSGEAKADALADCKREEMTTTPSPQFSPRVELFQQPLHRLEVLKPSLSQSVTRKTFDDRAIAQCAIANPPSVCAEASVDLAFDYYEITMRKQTLEILPASDGQPPIKANFWIYQGTGTQTTQPWCLGPLIRQPKGRASCIRFINKLGNDAANQPICTSIHLHGMASLPQYDGYAEDLIPLEHYKDYYYPNNRASTLWYHDHAVHKTSRNVYMGLAGMYIVEYGREDFCNPDDFGCLPSGEFEVPLIIQDKSFAPSSAVSDEWRLVFSDRDRRGVYADVVMVNGVPFPYFKVKRRKYYFRLLNASPSRTYQLVLSGDATRLTGDGLTTDGAPPQIIVIGTDAGLLAKPEPLTAPYQPLQIGVAERYGIVIDFSKIRPEVKHLYLRNLVFSGNLGTHSEALMRFDLEDGSVSDPSYIPARLGKLTDKQAMERRKTQTRTFRFGRGRDWTINGQTWSPSRVDGVPGQCAIEVWNLINTGGWTHPVHIHLIDFQILNRNGREPLPYERGWKDVVLLKDAERVQVVARFGPHRGKYMMHCHNLVHEDHDMMNQFEVGSGGPDPLSDPARPLPAEPLGSREPPLLVEDCLPCRCFEALPNSCPEG